MNMNKHFTKGSILMAFKPMKKMCDCLCDQRIANVGNNETSLYIHQISTNFKVSTSTAV